MAWYRDFRRKNWTMFRDYQNNIQYGIGEDKKWHSGEISYIGKVNSEYLASEEEVDKALRKEAKRRGFVEGTKFLGCEGNQKHEIITIEDIKFQNEHGNCGLYCEDSWIYLNGKWGEVVKGFDDKNVVCTWNDFFKGRLEAFNIKHSLDSKTVQVEVENSYFYHKSEKHGANFYEVVKEIQTKVGSEWKTFVIYKQLGSGLEFSREKEEFYKKFKQAYVY